MAKLLSPSKNHRTVYLYKVEQQESAAGSEQSILSESDDTATDATESDSDTSSEPNETKSSNPNDTPLTSDMAEGRETSQPTTADLKKLFEEQQVALCEQTKALTKLLDQSMPTKASHTSKSFSGEQIPTFSGKEDENVNDFLNQYDLATTLHGWKDDEKARALQLYLKDRANTWFSSTDGRWGRSYKVLNDALRERFHSASARYRIRQQLYQRRQLPSESVAEYATAMGQTYKWLDLSLEERINVRTPKNEVFLQLIMNIKLILLLSCVSQLEKSRRIWPVLV